jgi:uncharacterized protein
MHDRLTLHLAGEQVQVFADRALFWPAQGVLMIADLHLGKGEALRRGGIAVPSGGTRDDLRRLQSLVDTTGARELCVLGDFLHGPAGGGAWQEEWQTWRARNAATSISVVTGNHDRLLRRRAGDWCLQLLAEGEPRGPFELRHMPHRASTHVIAGHVHPRIRYPGLPGRWPAFLLQPGLTILPAFSRFTGGVDAVLDADDRCIACLDGVLAELPPRRG